MGQVGNKCDHAVNPLEPQVLVSVEEETHHAQPSGLVRTILRRPLRSLVTSPACNHMVVWMQRQVCSYPTMIKE
jgi:hypothetical protein